MTMTLLPSVVFDADGSISISSATPTELAASSAAATGADGWRSVSSMLQALALLEWSTVASESCFVVVRVAGASASVGGGESLDWIVLMF